jgi:hypothetical protein
MEEEDVACGEQARVPFVLNRCWDAMRMGNTAVTMCAKHA